MELSDGVETVSDAPTLEGRPFVAAAPDRRTVHDALLVPGWMTSLQPDYFLSYRLLPLSVDRTCVIADLYFHANAFIKGFDPGRVESFWDRTNAEDRAICERQQLGLATMTRDDCVYADVEDGVHAFDHAVARAYVSVMEVQG
jgi:Rieske 2Fe-2S family protein